MHTRDFLGQSVNSTNRPFSKLQEVKNKPKIKMPGFIEEIEKDQQTFFSFDTSVQPPPISTTKCLITETTNADPNILRSTMYTVPTSPSVFNGLNIPLTFILTPFSHKASPTELRKDDAVKCRTCQGYVNVFTKIEGSYFYCNLCGQKNTSANMINQEILKNSTIEYISDLPPIKRQRTLESNIIAEEHFAHTIYEHPVFVFGIDLTIGCLLAQAVQGLRNVLKDENFRFLYKKIVLFTFTDVTTLYKIKNGVITKILISEPYDYPFVSPDFFIDTTDEQNMNFLIELLEELEPESASAPALEPVLKLSLGFAGYSRGAKTALFTASGIIDTLAEFAPMFIEKKNSLNIFSVKDNSASKLCINTTGSFFVYNQESMYMLDSDLFSICTTKTSFGIFLETKTSDALGKSSFYGNTNFEHLGFQEFAQMDSNTTIGLSFVMDEPVGNKNKIYTQTILNFFAYDGSYRTLVINFSLTASEKITDVYASLSFDTLACAYTKYISLDTLDMKTKFKTVEGMICKMLKQYRVQCCNDASGTQFVLPESAKLIPLMFQSILKNNSISVNASFLDLKKIANFTVEQNLRFLYPRLFTFTDFYMDKSLDKVNSLPLSSDSLNSSDIFVLENSQRIYIYVAKNVDASLKEAIFSSETEENDILNQMVGEICTYYGYELPVIIVEEEKGGSEVEFAGYMIEDSLNGLPSYSDYIYELHFKVKNA